MAIGIETTLLRKNEIPDAGDILYTDAPPYANVFRELIEDIGKFVKPWDDAHEPYPDDVADKFYTKQIEKMVRANRYTKSNKWSYEEEFRVIHTKPGFVGFPSLALKEIIFGQCIDEKNIRTVMNVLRGDDWKHVRFSRAVAIPGTFQLSLIPVPAGTNKAMTERQLSDWKPAADSKTSDPGPDRRNGSAPDGH
ncbi:hypothetical protein KDW24_33480 [Burkholderia cenocepacia]|nr:hypothetical protein [Burkholderia cenocepacia]